MTVIMCRTDFYHHTAIKYGNKIIYIQINYQLFLFIFNEYMKYAMLNSFIDLITNEMLTESLRLPRSVIINDTAKSIVKTLKTYREQDTYKHVRKT